AKQAMGSTPSTMLPRFGTAACKDRSRAFWAPGRHETWQPRLFRSAAGERDRCAPVARIGNRQQKTPALFRARGSLLAENGVAVTYFRVRKRHTIIGANSFHSPVRDGKAWFQAAVAATWSGCAECTRCT